MFLFAIEIFYPKLLTITLIRKENFVGRCRAFHEDEKRNIRIPTWSFGLRLDSILGDEKARRTFLEYRNSSKSNNKEQLLHWTCLPILHALCAYKFLWASVTRESRLACDDWTCWIKLYGCGTERCFRRARLYRRKINNRTNSQLRHQEWSVWSHRSTQLIDSTSKFRQ